MKVPPKRKGNEPKNAACTLSAAASMKVPPKRKGNVGAIFILSDSECLNESPSEKEGKWRPHRVNLEIVSGPQ